MSCSMFLFKSSAPGPCSAGANHSALAVSLGHVMTTQDPGGLCTPKTLWVSLNATTVPCGPREATRVPGQPLLAWPWLAKIRDLDWPWLAWPWLAWPRRARPARPGQPGLAKIRDLGAKIRDLGATGRQNSRSGRQNSRFLIEIRDFKKTSKTHGF